MSNTRKQNMGVSDNVPISFAHYRAHDGELFRASHYMTITAASNYDILFKGPTGATAKIHLNLGIEADGACKIAFVEDNTCTSDTTTSFGTAFSPAPINVNRTSSKTTDVQFYYSPASPSGGTTLTVDVFGSASNKKNIIGGGLRPDSEFVLDPSKKYWIRLTNMAGTTITASFEAEFYTIG